MLLSVLILGCSAKETGTRMDPSTHTHQALHLTTSQANNTHGLASEPAPSSVYLFPQDFERGVKIQFKHHDGCWDMLLLTCKVDKIWGLWGERMQQNHSAKQLPHLQGTCMRQCLIKQTEMSDKDGQSCSMQPCCNIHQTWQLRNVMQ